MARLFISHSSRNDAQALALEDWLLGSGWGKEDIYLDISPDGGMAAGQRWVEALDDAQRRCEAIIFLVSKAWLSAKWCREEYDRALQLNKKMFALIIDNGVDLSDLPQGLTSQWQAVSLVPQKGKDTPTERFDTEHPITRETDIVRFTVDGLTRLRHGLTKAAIAPESFSLQKEAEGPLGWRMPYRGLEPLEAKDAAVFFGRDAEITQGLDVLRGLASKNPPRFMVILGASGAGKSSFLRAGLLPRLERDDANWLPMAPVRSGDDGPIEAPEGLLAQLQALHKRLGLESSRASLRRSLQDEESFVACLQALRQAAHKAALLGEGRDAPLPVLSIDQAEELFVSDAHDNTGRFLKLVRGAMMAGELVCIATIRSDRYSALQSEAILEGIEQTTFSLPPVVSGQLAEIINGPAQVWRREAGPAAPVFAPEVSQALMEEISGQQDALPLLAFAMARLINDHIGSDNTVEAKTITLEDLKATGGVAKTIELEADKALGDAGIDKDPKAREGILRDTFIPRLARVDKDSRDFERRVASLSDFSGARLRELVNAFVERRLLTLKAREGDPSVEVAHEALLRKWPTLSKILDAEKEDLIRLDTALNSAAQWEANGKAKDYIDHRGGRLEDLKTLATKSPEWNAALEPAKEYVDGCMKSEQKSMEQERHRLEKEKNLQIEKELALKKLSKRTTLGLLGASGLTVLSSGLAYWGTNAEKRFRQAKEAAETSAQEALQKRIDRQALRLDVSGTLSVFATAIGEVSFDSLDDGNEHGMSPFSYLLWNKLQDNKVSFEQAVRQTRDRLLELSSFRQRPFYQTDLNSEIYLSKHHPNRKLRALVIGVSPEAMGLYTAKNDAKNWASLLSDSNFQVTSVVNPENLSTVFENYTSELHQMVSYGHNVLSIIYFSGPGTSFGGTSYLIGNADDRIREADPRNYIKSISYPINGLLELGKPRNVMSKMELNFQRGLIEKEDVLGSSELAAVNIFDTGFPEQYDDNR